MAESIERDKKVSSNRSRSTYLFRRRRHRLREEEPDAIRLHFAVLVFAAPSDGRMMMILVATILLLAGTAHL